MAPTSASPPDPADGVAPAPVPNALNFPVVGLGASAGGIESLTRLFEQMPARPGMAFVVILHLSASHESNAASIVQRATGMPCVQVTESTRIEVDHVYFIPPGFDLLMDDGHLRPVPREQLKGPHLAIDLFFRTLASVHRERAVCVVLSGTGSDGAVGLTRIKELGGVTLAQTPEDAAYDGMPRAAIATGMVDIVLPAVDMAQRLIDLWANAQRIRLPDAEQLSPYAANLEDPLDAQRAESALQEVMALLRTYTQHDFRHYKRATVLRRIERRLQVNRLADLPAYRDFLHAHPDESGPLLQDMLISVTNFFRDREAFEALEREVVPQIVASKGPGDPVRAWVAGCATGEEAYSLSMLLNEHAAHQQSLAVDVQIFATDIDERAISVARKGLYPDGIVEDVPPSRLRHFFVKELDQYRVTGSVREPVLFAVHNLLRDPPFSRLDLICCRNLLIYLDRNAQAHVLEMFRVALKPGGYLFLGTSESADVVGSLFTAVDKKHRIYRVNPQVPPARHLPLISDLPMERAFAAQAAGRSAMRQQRPAFAELHQRALEQFSPPSVLIDAQHNVLHLSNGVGRFLEHGSGLPSHNLLHNVRADIRLELRTALFKAMQSQHSVETRLTQQETDGRKRFLNITVRPFQQEADKPALTLVVFDEVEESMTVSDGAPPDAARAELIGQLEEEIKQLKLHLQDTLEGSESSTEELKASNEELQAINEELRSATEELETSKEELQSMNEELVTVNYELKIKVEERGHINDDLQNLITSSEIATVFVDRGMRIKRYTPHASRLFNLIPSDMGRSLFDMTSRLDYAELADDAASAFKTLRVIERRVASNDGRHFFARILPYRTAEDKIEGAILNFFDVTELRRAEDRVRLAAATTRDYAIITTDGSGMIVTWNVGAERIFGYREDEMVGRSFATIFTSEDQAKGAPAEELRRALEAGRAEDDRWHQRKDGSRLFCSGVTTPLDGDAGKGFAKIARDMTGTKQQELAQEHLLFKEKKASLSAQMANELKDKFLAVMSHELKQPLNLIQMNAELLTRLPGASDNPSVRRIGDTIKRAVSSQTKIINDLLDLSRIRTGKLRLNRVSIDLGDVARSLVQSATADAERRKITLDVQSEPGLGCYCDPVRAEQIIWNLISNALKFTPEGGRVTVALTHDAEFAKITVTDTGIGIAPEFLPHVFGMFNQATVDVQTTNGGLGIGLALVQELTHAHGGRVEVTSEGVGEGASFSVWLPLNDDVVPAATTSSPASVSLANWRVLAVDDYADGLVPFAEVLRLEGATVDIAESGKKALELLETNTYDLLVSDLGMPEMDGYQLIAEVRRRPATQGLAAIAMSGFGRRADARRALEAGFNAHVSKPAAVEELKAALSRL